MCPRKGKIESFLRTCIERRFFPGSVYLIGERDKILTCGALGYAVVQPEKITMKEDSIFDLASLTKPLCTALLSILLIRKKVFSLNDYLFEFLPEFRKSDKRKIKLSHLLTHTSGLPSWLPLYIYGDRIKKRLQYLSEWPLKFPPGKGLLYGCPAYILMSEVIQRVTGERLDKLFSQWISSPLRLKDTGFNPSIEKKRKTVASEKGNAFEKKMTGGAGQSYQGWREKIIWGEVHDHNSFTQGGVSGNAGLFSTAGDLFLLSKEFLGVGRGLLTESERRMFFKNRTKGYQEDRTIGWQMASTSGSSAGPLLSSLSIGHTGFTGVSLWIDPQKKRTYIFLTNRIHPRYREFNMNAIRRSFHSLAAVL